MGLHFYINLLLNKHKLVVKFLMVFQLAKVFFVSTSIYKKRNTTLQCIPFLIFRNTQYLYITNILKDKKNYF